ncbi:unnamed protein product [Linum trigynum]|uniref:Uncharacterized protein n=1 Tax=Linum trigynum TaxID=586398 RepID=A0AAV2DT75_9ROSI
MEKKGRRSLRLPCFDSRLRQGTRCLPLSFTTSKRYHPAGGGWEWKASMMLETMVVSSGDIGRGSGKGEGWRR